MIRISKLLAWPVTVVLLAAGPAAAQLAPSGGGTGVNNGSNTLTLGGSLKTTDTYTLQAKQSPSPVQYLTGSQTEAQLLSGSIDAQPSISAALAVGPVRLACGTYRLDSSLSFSSSAKIVLDGGSPGCVTLAINFPAGDVVLANQTQRLRLSHLTFDIYAGAAARTSGAVLHLYKTYDAQLDDIAIAGPQFGDAILVDGANTTRISNFDCRPPVPFVTGSFGAGACIHGTGPAGPGFNGFVDLFVSNGNSASYHYGMQITYGSGLEANNLDFVESGSALDINPSFSASQSVNGINFSALYADTSAGNNILIEGDGWVTDAQFSTVWASNSQNGSGIAFENPRVNGVQLVSPTILGNYGHGLLIDKGTRITVTGGHSFMNSRAGNNLWDDIYIGSAAGNIISILGAQVGTGGTILASGGAPMSRYGINVAGGNPSGQTITVKDLIASGEITANCKLPENKPPYLVIVSGTNCGTPWSQAAQTVTASTGTLTSAGGYVRWFKDGTKVDVKVVISVTTNGSGSNSIRITMPFQNGPVLSVIYGRDILTGKMLSGTINPNSNIADIFFYDNTYPGANGAALILSGVYEAAS